MIKTQQINTIITAITLIILLTLIKNNHPIFIIINLIIYRLLICIIISTWTYNFIYSIIIFLIIIRGLLIIFLYFSRLISNEKNRIKNNKLIWTNIIINLTLIIYIILNTKTFPAFYSQENQPILLINNPTFSNIFKIYNHPFNNLTLICIIFLLTSLIIIIKICSIKSSPLRKIS